jgi:hypothetical protein
VRPGAWTAKSIPVVCGYDGHWVSALNAVWEKPRENGTSVYRCELHAPDPAPIDYGAVDRALHAIEVRRSGETANLVTKSGDAHAPVLAGFAPIGAAADQGLNHLLKHTGGIQGVRRNYPVNPRPVQPHARVAHIADPKARAVND